MTRIYWPEEAKKMARRMRLDGVSLNKTAAAIQAHTGRPCAEYHVRKWCRGLPGGYADKAPWPDRWKRRARELRLMGLSKWSVAAAIESESGRPCNPSTVWKWLNK